MSIIVAASYARALMPGVREWIGGAYSELPEEFKEIFDSFSSDKNFEEDVNTYGLGLARVKPEGASTQYDTMGQGFITRYQHITYALGYIISREAFKDNQYMQLAEQRSKHLGMSMKQTRENVAANILNRAFSGSYTYGDGLSLLNTGNLLSKGGTFSNRPTNGVDLSEAALEDALNQIGGYVNDAGLRIAAQGLKLIVPIQLQFEAERILGNSDRPGTADRDINALVKKGMLPQGYVLNHYLTDSDAWFIKTSVPGMKHFEREPVTIQNDSDFDTDNMKVKAFYRDSFGCSDKRSIYGSPGA